MADLVTPLTPWLHSPRSSTDVSSLKAVSAVPPTGDLVAKWEKARDFRLVQLLPSPSFLYQHPLHVVTTRQLLGPYTAKPSLDKGDSLYLRTAQDPSIRRLFVDAKSSGYVDGDGKDIKTIQARPLVESDIWTTAREIRVRYGWRGFFRGALGAHCIDLLNTGLATNLEFVAQKATVACVGEASKADEEQRPLGLYRRRPLRQRIYMWLQRSEGRLLLSKILAANVAHALTYPLSTISIRQVAYESYDGVRVGFIDMARLTILYDGSRAFYRGFGSYALAKFITSLVELSTNCASAICNFPTISDNTASVTEVLVTPLMQHSRHLRALSNMPGLPQECPPLSSRISALFSPVCLVHMVVNGVTIFYRMNYVVPEGSSP